MEIYYGVLPEERLHLPSHEQAIHLGYRVSGSELLAPEARPSFSGGILALGAEGREFDAEQAVIKLMPFLRARAVKEVWLDMEETPAARSLARGLRSAKVPLSAGFDTEGVSRVVKIGGVFPETVKETCKGASHGVTIELIPASRMLPENGRERELSRAELFRFLLRSPKVRFSEGLMLNTFETVDGTGSRCLITFDDHYTMEKKLDFAKKSGVARVFLRYLAQGD